MGASASYGGLRFQRAFLTSEIAVSRLCPMTSDLQGVTNDFAPMATGQASLGPPGNGTSQHNHQPPQSAFSFFSHASKTEEAVTFVRVYQPPLTLLGTGITLTSHLCQSTPRGGLCEATRVTSRRAFRSLCVSLDVYATSGPQSSFPTRRLREALLSVMHTLSLDPSNVSFSLL